MTDRPTPDRQKKIRVSVLSPSASRVVFPGRVGASLTAPLRPHTYGHHSQQWI
jgi:hypothetical protein